MSRRRPGEPPAAAGAQLDTMGAELRLWWLDIKASAEMRGWQAAAAAKPTSRQKPWRERATAQGHQNHLTPTKQKHDLNLSQEDCALTKSVQYCLDRLYISRISLNMLTNQHLMLHGYKNPVPGQVGVIHPTADVEAIVRHAYSDARFLCERCYLNAPGLELKSHNLTEPKRPVSVKHVPSHIYYMAFEVSYPDKERNFTVILCIFSFLQVIKNAMQATVNHNDLDNLPSIQVLVCQSDNDITIKISDEGGGVDRVTCEKIWKYLYTTTPRPSVTSESAALSGLGYGLPLSRLYARYSEKVMRSMLSLPLNTI